MKLFQAFGIFGAAILAVSGAATPNTEGHLETFELNQNTYFGEMNRAKAIRDIDNILSKRCNGPENQPVNTACKPGACQCEGLEGCYSCNGKPAKCQATNSAGQPVTCY